MTDRYVITTNVEIGNTCKPSTLVLSILDPCASIVVLMVTRVASFLK